MTQTQLKTKIVNSFLKIEKRIRFVAATLILTFFMLFSTFFFFDKAWIFIPILALATYGFTYFAILEGIEKTEWFTLFITPVLFTIAFYLFYFLFPVRWLTRLPFIFLYGVSIYAILLTSNIFNVGVEKSLQLYRAAYSVNYFYHTLLVFLISNILFSLRENFLVNAIVGGLMIYPLSFQLFWTVKLNLTIERSIILFAFFSSIIFAQVALVVSFVPFQTTIISLILAALYYSLSGLVTAKIDERLFAQTVREYLFVLGFVIFISILTLSW